MTGRFIRLSMILAAGVAISTPASAKDFRVAFLAASSQNGFNQAIFEGVKKRAEKIGGVSVEIFDGEFNATKQYSQVEDVTTSGKFDALIICPNDSVGIATAVGEATKAGLKVATTLFPIGPKLDTLEPQVEGLTATVASNPAIGAKEQAQAVVDYCNGKDPCNVVIIIGQKIYPFDNLRLQTFNDTLAISTSPARLTLTLQGTEALLNWTGGVPPLRVQWATDLIVGDWTDFLTNATPPVPLPLTNRAAFYRLVGN